MWTSQTETPSPRRPCATPIAPPFFGSPSPAPTHLCLRRAKGGPVRCAGAERKLSTVSLDATLTYTSITRRDTQYPVQAVLAGDAGTVDPPNSAIPPA